MKLWQKNTKADDWVIRFTVGEDYMWDTLLLPYDIQGTRAHVWAIQQIGLLSPEELIQINSSLDELDAAYQAGNVEVTPDDEDCHTVIEQHLTVTLGETGKKIHAGRSRNDQVLVALRLFLREQLQSIGDLTRQVGLTLCDLGEQNDHLLFPGYTHYQRAMPSTAGLWAMGYAELLVSDLATLKTALNQINISPWGSAAGYGVPYLIMPRSAFAERLGFNGVQQHVTAVQLSRGKFELQVVHALVQIAATLNRLASDLVLFNTAEYGFVELPAEYCTGSSIMPQKRNPDVLELARANYHRLLAEMNLLSTLPSNLPSGYHRDLQLTKEAVMRSTLLAQDLVMAMYHLLPGIRFNEEQIRQACTPELFATAHALEKVEQGIPFRQAYQAAAAELNQIKPPTSEEALAAYRVAGYPGHVQAGAVRALLGARG
jgi:argininosuccinate lyase